MKKALLLVIGIVAVCFLIANADYLASFLATLKTFLQPASPFDEP